MKNVKRTRFSPNSYEMLKMWLKEDIEVYRPIVKSFDEQKLIFRTAKMELKKIATKCKKYESSILFLLQNIEKKNFYSAMQDIVEYVSALFIKNCFTKEIYHRKVEELRSSKKWSTQINKRMTGGRYKPHASRDFFVMFRRNVEWKNFSYLEKGSLLLRAALKLFVDFKERVGVFHEDRGKLGSYKQIEFLFSSCASSREFPGSLEVGESARHVAVIIGSFLFKLQAFKNNNDLLTLGEIFQQLKEIESTWLGLESSSSTVEDRFRNVGSLSFGDRLHCHNARMELINSNSKNEEFFKTLDTAIFVMCLDIPTENDKNRKNPSIKNPLSVEEIQSSISRFTSNCQNRWFGQTQFIISGNCDIFMYNSYSKGVEGHFALSLGEVIEDSITETSKLEQFKSTSNLEIYFKEIPLYTCHIASNNKNSSISSLNDPSYSKMFFHQKKCIFRMGFGSNYFKMRNLSPNISFNILLALSMYSVVGLENFSTFSYPTGLQDKNLSSSLNWQNLNLKNAFSPLLSNQKEFKKKFGDAVNYEVKRMKLSKTGGSPTLLTAPCEDKNLMEFFFNIAGKMNYFHGLKLHLYFLRLPIPLTIDVITSSMPFKKLACLGRPGVYLPYLKYFGVHVFIKEETTELVFIPNISFADKLEMVVERWIEFAMLLQ